MKILCCLLIALTGFFNFDCSKNKNTGSLTNFSGSELKTLINKTVNGDKDANNSIKLFEQDKIPVPQKYNNFILDSIILGTSKLYYSLIQFPNPEYNRLALYDSKGHLLLLDKSLNGDISLSPEEKDSVEFLKAVESFLSKDALSIKRLSFYKLDPRFPKLAFRSYITLVSPNNIFSQDISKFTKDTILTEITLPSKLSAKYAKSDTFVYDPSFGKYISRNSSFDSLVKQQVTDFNIANP